MIRKLATKAAILTAGVAAAVAMTAAPAAAANVEPEWFGAVHVTLSTSTSYGGWIDGNGPDSYYFSVACSNGYIYDGVTRWAGDRRGSFAYCPSGSVAQAKGYTRLYA